jgi:hypothetical protein
MFGSIKRLRESDMLIKEAEMEKKKLTRKEKHSFSLIMMFSSSSSAPIFFSLLHPPSDGTSMLSNTSREEREMGREREDGKTL